MMNQKNRLRLVEGLEWFWKRRCIVFFGVFGVVWLFFEPLLAFTVNTDLLSFLGAWRYIILLLISVFITFLVEYMERIKELGDLSIINFTIIVTENGKRYQIEAPQDMRTEKLIDLFLQKISRDISSKSKLSLNQIYKYNLMVKQDDGHYRETRLDSTLRENKLKDGDECKIYCDINLYTIGNGGGYGGGI